MRYAWLWALLLCALPVLAFHPEAPLPQRRGPAVPYIRVLLAATNGSLRLGNHRGFLVSGADGRLVRMAGQSLVLEGRQQTILCNGRKRLQAPLIVVPQTADLLFARRAYRGRFLVNLSNRTLRLVNRLSLEEYLKGVLPHEIDHRWPMEALKAQAIASRSYAYKRLLEGKGKRYDLDASTWSQLYRGKQEERERCTRAIIATSRVILWNGKRPAVGFFHSCCGGVTEDSGRVWSLQLPYLRSRRSPYCRGSKHYRWSAILDVEEAGRLCKLSASLVGARVSRRTPAGRVEEVVLKSVDGHLKRYKARAFRRMIGVNRLKSSLFNIRLYGRRLAINGRGWGHGVGLCQYCARGMARRGFTAYRILRYFYQGVGFGPYPLQRNK